MIKKICFISILGALLLSGCNMPDNAANTELTLQAQAGTLAAQTVTAAAAAQEIVPSETPRPMNTPTQALPTVTPAPSLTPTATAKLSVPEKPSLDTYNFTCAWNGANLDLNITILWVDHADNEQGYYVYRNGEQIADLAPNTARHIDLYAVDGGIDVNYAIESYNNLGRSEQINIAVKCE